LTKQSPGKVTNIKKYRRPLNLNIGMIIFAVIFIYILVCVAMYFKQTPIAPYVVQEGFLSTNKVYTGIALRNEVVVTAQDSGHVNYFAREGERVAVGNLVYTVDETGRLVEYLNDDATGENTLSERELSELKSEIVNFEHGFNPHNFASTYDFKFSVQGTVLRLANHALIDSIRDINKNTDLTDLVNFHKASHSGIVEYWVDGYEELTPDMINASHFNNPEYKRTQMLNNQLLVEGDKVYKVCTDEEWSLVFPIEEQKGQELLEEEYIKVRFLKNQDEAWGQVSLHHGTDGTYLELSFTNSMITFARDRYLDVELILNESTGLKIPNSSVAEREFFLVPEEYITQSGSTKTYGVLRETVLENGELSTEYIETSIYSKKDGEYYLNTMSLRTGDRIIKPETSETYTISKKATLIGVYNMNKGYADFRQIEILYQNDEYSIVKSNTQYGLNVYDLIVLDAASVDPDQFVYE